MNPHQPSQLLTNLGLAALAGFAALAGLFRLSGTITAFLTGHPQPAGERACPRCPRRADRGVTHQAACLKRRTELARLLQCH